MYFRVSTLVENHGTGTVLLMATQIKVLFLCTGNACRSQMAEALLRQIGVGRFEARSAGSHPAGFIHPLAEKAMANLGVEMGDQHSKGWDEFATEAVDLVITLCDAAASTPCPVWPGAPITAHWPLPDPAGFLGEESERIRFADEVAARIKAKIEALCGLGFTNTPPDKLREAIHAMGAD